MSTIPGLVTVEEFLKLPEANEGHYELHHGEVVLVPPGKRGHQRIQHEVRILLERLAGGRGAAEIEWAFRPSPEYEVWVADVALVAAERDARTGDDEYLQGAPDIVVEVLSPSNTAEEINDRMAICLENGCSSFWVVDSKRRRVSVTEGEVTKHYAAGSSFPCDVLGATVPVREIFE